MCFESDRFATKHNLMKKATCLLLLFVLHPLFSQEKVKDSLEYRRSSLHMIMLDSNNFPNGGKETVVNAYHQAPFPEKYNDHRLEEDKIDPNLFWLSESEVPSDVSSKKRASYIKHEVNDENTPIIIQKYFSQQKTANKLVAKWFNQDDKGAFDMSLIGERGFYDASAMDIEKAKSTIRGINGLADKGEELIQNTFIVVSKFKYISNEVAAKITHTTAVLAANKLPGLAATLAQKAADIIYNKTRKGYSVWTTSYLYQLEWNQDVANQFYENYWMDKNSLDDAKKEAFDASSLFKLKLLGEQSNKNIILFTGGKTTNTTEKIITKATIRNIEKVFVKLQKKYEVFMPKTPLHVDDNGEYYADLGLKEGITKRTKFEALEIVKDELTGEVSYNKIGLLKVDRKRIWDNQFGAKDEEEKNKDSELKGTYFKGCKKCYAGVLIRQIK